MLYAFGFIKFDWQLCIIRKHAIQLLAHFHASVACICITLFHMSPQFPTSKKSKDKNGNIAYKNCYNLVESYNLKS